MSKSFRSPGDTTRRSHRRNTVVSALAAAVVGSFLSVASAETQAWADTAPVPPVTVPTVSADALPTAQINGVAWDQVIVGNTVYVTGEFTSARPAGAPAGTSEQPRSNLMAYDLTTGALLPWAPTLNAKGGVIKASSDGSKIFVGGSFTSVNGVTRNRLVALDPVTGAVVANWNPNVASRVSSLAIQGDTLYLGGIFNAVSGQTRGQVAAVTASTGQLTNWAPTANAEVMAITAPAGSGNVVVGGRFTQLNGTDEYGLGALDAITGAVKPFAINSVVRNAGVNAAIYSLTTDGGQVYGTGYTYGSGGNFENTFAARATDGALVWVSGCLGDTYDATVTNGVLYYASHTHNCSVIGGLPQTTPTWTFQRASAETAARAASGLVNAGGKFSGSPAPEILHWTPDLDTGTYTGKTQAAWTIESNSNYVVAGGEFPSVNGTPQQGLVRFAVTSKAPNKMGPEGISSVTLSSASAGPGALRLSWQAAFDRDNRRLKYEVLRGATVGQSAVVGSSTVDSVWWTRPAQSFVDGSAPGGSSQTYRIRFTDAFGNTAVSNPATFTIPAGTAGSGPYSDAVRADGAANYWRLGEPSGTAGYDWGSTPNDLTLAAGATRGVAGAIPTEPNLATTFPGSATAPAYSTTAQIAPSAFTEEAWVKTTTSSGGKIIGFGNSRTGSSSTYDRQVYMTNSGQLIFGMSANGQQVVTSPGTYRDGAWHHISATYGNGTMQLFVDGQLVGAKSGLTAVSSYSGYWRVGGDNLGNVFGGWPSRPSSAALAGTIDEAAVYPTALTGTAIARHNTLGRALSINRAPTASFTSVTTNLSVAFSGLGSTDPDGTIASYAWNFGDGATGTGSAPSHAYGTAGTYTVSLTVTDNQGATGTESDVVTATNPPVQGETLAADTFERTVASGLGVADSGGAWAVTGSGTSSSVGNGSGALTVPAGATLTARLNSPSILDTDVVQSIWTEDAVTGGGVFITPVVRASAGGEYRVRAKILPSGQVTASLANYAGGVETALTGTVSVPALTYTVGSKLRVRVQAIGTAPTTLAYKIWLDGTSEPATWLQTVTDTTGVLQSAGAVGLNVYTSGSATATPVIHIDDLKAVSL